MPLNQPPSHPGLFIENCGPLSAPQCVFTLACCTDRPRVGCCLAVCCLRLCVCLPQGWDDRVVGMPGHMQKTFSVQLPYVPVSHASSFPVPQCLSHCPTDCHKCLTFTRGKYRGKVIMLLRTVQLHTYCAIALCCYVLCNCICHLCCYRGVTAQPYVASTSILQRSGW